MVDHLPSMCKALDLMPALQTNKKRKQEKKKKFEKVRGQML